MMNFTEATADPIAYIQYLTENIRDGVLRLPDWDCPENPFHDGVEGFPVHEGEQYKTAAALHTVHLLSELREIAPHWEALRGNPDCAETLLGRQHFCAWEQYVKPFETADVDVERVMEIADKYDNGEPVTDEEDALYERYVRLTRSDAARRLGEDKPFAYEEILRASRYCRLVNLKAPDCVTKAEACMLAQYVLLNWCAVKD